MKSMVSECHAGVEKVRAQEDEHPLTSDQSRLVGALYAAAPTQRGFAECVGGRVGCPSAAASSARPQQMRALLSIINFERERARESERERESAAVTTLTAVLSRYLSRARALGHVVRTSRVIVSIVSIFGRYFTACKYVDSFKKTVLVFLRQVRAAGRRESAQL